MNDSWNASLYDGKHSYVSRYGNDLITLLAPKKGEKILDLGCGTGDLANELYEMGAYVVGIDNSIAMVEQAKDKYSHIKFLACDALDLEFKNEFNAVFSNATLHWIQTPSRVLERIYNSLKPSGRFIAEFGGKGNVQLITDEISNQKAEMGYKKANFPWYFPSVGEYTNLMEEVGFTVKYAEHFDRPTPLEGDKGLRNWIMMFADSMFDGISDEEKEVIIRKVEENLRDKLYKDEQWTADYKRLRVMAIKER